MERPFVTIFPTVSLDGCLDDISSDRLMLSTPTHFEYQDKRRSEFDAIFIGAETVRRDNPRLSVKSEIYVNERLESGKPAQPTKVTLSRKGELDPQNRFFSYGDSHKLLYHCNESLNQDSYSGIDKLELVFSDSTKLDRILCDLSKRGIMSVLVEGGGMLITQFIKQDLFDQLEISIAPFFVGEKGAPKFVQFGTVLASATKRLCLESCKQIDDMAILVYGK